MLSSGKDLLKWRKHCPISPYRSNTSFTTSQEAASSHETSTLLKKGTSAPQFFIRREDNIRRQKTETYYRINGAIYFARIEGLRMDGNLYRKGSFAYIMEQERSIDIDTELDFLYAELIPSFFR